MKENMSVGEVIKRYRKSKHLTQEEMASRLGVTAPAVNKWEKGNALPDVALLAPIARLLGITTDELLSFKDELTDEEINQYLSNIQKDLESKSFRHIFLSVKEKIAKYPNCEKLIWQAAVILDANRMTIKPPDKDNYEDMIDVYIQRMSGSAIKRQIRCSMGLSGKRIMKKRFNIWIIFPWRIQSANVKKPL